MVQVQAAPHSQKTGKGMSDQQQVSYTMGYQMGKSLKKNSFDLNGNALLQGIRDSQTGKQRLSDKQMKAVMMKFQQQMMAKVKAKMTVLAENNMKAGKDFLAQNEKQAGVVITKSGLQYKVMEPGKGDSPKATDKVTVDYEGRLINGHVFDSSYKRGTPATFGVNQVIPGWTEMLQLMKPGETVMVYIPSKLAYGERGAPGAIGPNEALVFKVHLKSIN